MLANKRQMSDLQQQLAILRQRMARVMEQCAEKYETPAQPRRWHIDEWMPGEEIETGRGKHFEA